MKKLRGVEGITLMVGPDCIITTGHRLVWLRRQPGANKIKKKKKKLATADGMELPTKPLWFSWEGFRLSCV